jgi:hypothetical protein
MLDKNQAMNDTELTIKGIEALNQSLGISATLRFLTLLHGEETDYVEISRQLYQGQTLDEIFERARQNY